MLNYLIRNFHCLVAKYYLKRPELSDFLFVKFPTLNSVYTAAINEVFYKIRTRRGFKLTSVNLEVANHCNLKCSICPTNNMTRPKGYMDFKLAKKIIDENPQLETILFHQWGEPLLHPEIFDMINYAAKKQKRTMFTTNGFLLDDKTTDKVLSSGLTRITISIDGTADTYKKIRKLDYENIKSKIIAMCEKRDKKHSPLKIDISMVVSEETDNECELVKKEWETIVDSVQFIPKLEYNSKDRNQNTERKAQNTENNHQIIKSLNHQIVNHQLPLRPPCRELWRGVIVVLWDGSVSACCVDYDKKLIIGSAIDKPLSEIWNGEKMNFIRQKHINKDFPELCMMCNEYQSSNIKPRFRNL